MARPALAESQVLEQRSRLLAAALSLYRTQGHEAVTFRSLAAQLGISHVTPYRYFKSKDDLFAAIRTEVYSHFAAHLEQADSPELEPLDRLRNLGMAIVSFAWQFPEDYRLIFSLRQPPVSDYPELQAVRIRSLNYGIVICEKAVAAGHLEGDAVTWAHLVWASVHGLLSLHVANLLVMGRSLEDLVVPLLNALVPTRASSKCSPLQVDQSHCTASAFT